MPCLLTSCPSLPQALAARLLQLTAQGCSLQREAPPPRPELQPRPEGEEEGAAAEGPAFAMGNGNGSRSRQFNLVAAQAGGLCAQCMRAQAPCNNVAASV